MSEIFGQWPIGDGWNRTSERRCIYVPRGHDRDLCNQLHSVPKNSRSISRPGGSLLWRFGRKTIKEKFALLGISRNAGTGVAGFEPARKFPSRMSYWCIPHSTLCSHFHGFLLRVAFSIYQFCHTPILGFLQYTQTGQFPIPCALQSAPSDPSPDKRTGQRRGDQLSPVPLNSFP